MLVKHTVEPIMYIGRHLKLKCIPPTPVLGLQHPMVVCTLVWLLHFSVSGRETGCHNTRPKVFLLPAGERETV